MQSTNNAFSHLGNSATPSSYYEPETLLEVSVGNPTRVGGHIEYQVVLESNLPQFPKRSETWHRYSDFVALRSAIRLECPQTQLPTLPGKWYAIREMAPKDIQERVKGLDMFLSAAVSHPLINTRSKALLHFLSQ